MKLANIYIKNYKALKDVSIPLSQFVCLTGENNAGKSSILQAISLFMSPSKLESHHFHDPSKEITITITFGGIEEDDLVRLDEEPRERIREIMKEKTLELTRRFKLGEDHDLGYYTMLPKNKNYRKDVVDAALKGKKKEEIVATVVALIPEKENEIPATLATQKDAKALIEKLGAALPAEDKEMQFKPIPTGAGFSIAPLLPEDIYIPAVKDLKDDINLKQGSSLGKVLGILMGKIEAKLSEEKGLFEKLRAKLTRVQTEGAVADTRLQEIKDIEAMIQKFVRESFASVDLELEIPPPELKTVLSTASIFVNDGTRGPIDFKGDGLRRAVFFSILRTYVELRVADAKAEIEEGAAKPAERGYVLLFEEPELFLHPDAQKILFDALRIFSKDHHVVVTTHSPLFLGPGAATFVRLSKQAGATPFTKATPVNLNDLNPKDEFQLICFENNNAALFSKRIVLVEGDSEIIVLPHVAATLNAEWSCEKHSIAFVQVKGKGSVQRYRRFFKRFDVPTFVVVDLDAVNRDFDKLDPTEAQKKMRSDLLVLVDKTLPKAQPEPGGAAVKEAHGKTSLKALWAKARQAKSDFDGDKAKLPELEKAVQEFFDWEKKESRVAALQQPPNDEIKTALHDLLASMRESGVFILSKGEIEDYYPDGEITGNDKPSKAQSYRNLVTSREQVLLKCPEIRVDAAGATKHELELICEAVFGEVIRSLAALPAPARPLPPRRVA